MSDRDPFEAMQTAYRLLGEAIRARTLLDEARALTALAQFMAPTPHLASAVKRRRQDVYATLNAPVEDGGEGMSLAEIGAAMDPPISRGRVGHAIKGDVGGGAYGKAAKPAAGAEEPAA
jgi:hypothetical protein